MWGHMQGDEARAAPLDFRVTELHERLCVEIRNLHELDYIT